MADFNRGCLDSEQSEAKLETYGFAIYYRRCQACEFLFTDAFDAWSEEEFRTHIYNAEYAQLDPSYQRSRPAGNAGFIAQLFGAHKDTLRVLDFGGGNGVLAECLRGAGFRICDTYDPFTPGFDTLPDRTYNLITCFETMEHTPDPGACVRAIMEKLTEDGVVVFSTLLQPADFAKIGMSWWYIGPRNGHISLHSKKSLALLWERHGCAVESVTENVHMASRRDAKDRLRLGVPAASAA
jgi:2-polyprenyl-6-hydroxyphenyl methylase/3-demethylubiquinone-9 3-methyltransferase